MPGRPKDPSIPEDGLVKTYVGEPFKEEITDYCKRAGISQAEFLRDAIATHWNNCTASQTRLKGPESDSVEIVKGKPVIKPIKDDNGAHIKTEGVCPSCGAPKLKGPPVLGGPKLNKPTYPPSFYEVCSVGCGWYGTRTGV